MRGHTSSSLSDGAMQLFFQRDLWLDEVVALMLANGDSPTPAMRTATHRRCGSRRAAISAAGDHGHLARQLLYPEWLVRLGASDVCQVAITAPPSRGIQ